MSFVNAVPLWLFVALPLIPVLLHLLTLQRLRTIELPTYRFLFDSYVQQRRRTQFLEALLAMLRVLFVLGIVALIARPVARQFSGLFQAGSGREVILLVDCSASMNAQAKGETAFQRAQTLAKQVVGRLSADDRVTLIRVAGKPEEVVSRFTADVGGIQAGIDRLQISPARGNLFAALNAVFGDENHQPANPLVYFFTDAQANGWKEIERQKQIADRFVPAGTPFVLVDVGSAEDRTNVAVVGDAPPRQQPIAGLPVTLRARVLNASASETDATLTFLVNDKEVERQSLKLQPHETVTRKLAPYTPAQPGVLKGRFEVSLGSRGADAFPEDDRYLFTLQVQPKLKVLIVNGNPSPEPADDAAFYLKAALNVSGEAVGAKLRAAADRFADFAQALEVTDEPEQAWAGLDEKKLKDKLDQYAVVILADSGQLQQYTPAAYPALRDYVAGGGGLLIFPGEKVNPDVYNTAFFPSPPPLKDQLITARLAKVEGDPDHAETFRKLARIDFDHRVFSVFDRPGAPENRYFERVAIKRHFPLTLQDGRGVSVLAEYPDHGAAVVEGRYGDGVVLMTSFPMNAKWTNLPLRVEFVPLVLQMVAYAQRRPDAEGPAVVPAGGSAEVSVTNAWAPVSGTVTDAASHKLDLAFERSGGRAVSVYDQTGERGYYAVDVKGVDPSKAATLAFAVNLAPEESETTRVDEARVKELLPSAKVTYVDRSAEAAQAESLDTNTEFWRPVIWLMFLIIGAEFLLATLRGGRAPGEEAPTVAERIAGYSPTSWVGRMTGRK